MQYFVSEAWFEVNQMCFLKACVGISFSPSKNVDPPSKNVDRNVVIRMKWSREALSLALARAAVIEVLSVASQKCHWRL
jgi:hypothetical protein